MKNVLVVDDEKSFVLSLVEGLFTYAADFNTLTAENGKKALDVLNSTQVDLVVTDLKMPEMDGFELLAHMSRSHPGIPVIVMTAYSTPEIKSKLDTMGAFHVLEKPLDFEELVDGIFAELSAVSKGYIRGITLPAFLQLLEIERKTCTLKVMSRGRTGYLYFREGELMDAETGADRGEKAAYEIICWDEAEMELSSVCRKLTREIEASLGHILMEGFRIKDERSRSADGGDGADKGQVTGREVIENEGPAVELEEATDQDNAGDYTWKDEKEVRMAGIKDILNEFTKLQGVDAVCLVGRDGFLLDSIAKTGIDSEMMGAIASSGFGAAESMGRQLGKGQLSMSMIEFEKGPVMFSPVGGDAFIVIVADKDSNLGMIRLRLKKHTNDLALAATL